MPRLRPRPAVSKAGAKPPSSEKCPSVDGAGPVRLDSVPMGDRLAERAAFWWLLLPIVFGLLLRALRRPAFFHRYVGEATLASIRVLTCAILLAHVMVEDLASTAWLPRRLVEPMGVLQLLYALPIGFRGFLASPAALSVFRAVRASPLRAGPAGCRARATLPLAALG